MVVPGSRRYQPGSGAGKGAGGALWPIRPESRCLNCGVWAWVRAARSRSACGWMVIERPSAVVVQRARSGQPVAAERESATGSAVALVLRDGPLA